MVVYRLDAIAWGVAMAELYRVRSRLFEHPRVALGCGLAVIAMVAVGRLPGPGLFPATVFSFTMFGCALLIVPALKLRALPAWFARPVRAVSAWSYCLYLVHHWILLDFAQGLWWRHALPAWACTIIAVVAPFVIAWASFRFFEAPILKLRPHHGGGRADPGPAVEAAPVRA